MIPATPADITASWLTEALQDGGKPIQLASVEVEPLGPSVGMLGDLARVQLSYRAGTGPATVIVKLPTADPGGHQVGSMLGAWAWEVAFYREVAPSSPGAELPRCYHADGDAEAGRWVVVLEDCPHHPIDPVAGADGDAVAVAIDALARFHAAWWQADRTFDWMPGFDRTGFGGLQGLWLDTVPLFLDRYGHLIPEPTGEWLQAFAPLLSRWAGRVAGEPLTIVHADYRLDNLLFHDGTVTMIDWQTALRGPGAMDLTSLLITGLTIEDRRAGETELIERYLSGLDTAGVSLDRAWFDQSYDENLLWWMGQFANNLARLHPENDATQRSLDTMIERTYTAALDRNAGRLIDGL